MYRIFRVEAKAAARIDLVLKDDLVSRQSISQRDAQALGAQGGGIIVLIEGSEPALHRSEELFKGIGERVPEAEAKHIYELFKRESEDVASGVGFVFGP